ncbi:MAG: N-acetylneuraminate synthase [Bacteroidetes bacterium]|nr:N-acetylneuraminate synthase [Bacteroidota bacterium]
MKKVIIIAEAGVNHNGDIHIAKKLIDAAAKAGADFVKFQTFNARLMVSPAAKKARYQMENMKIVKEKGQYDMLRKLELNRDAHKVLITCCKKKKIEFLSSPFDPESVELLRQLGLGVFKIPSGEITNLPLLKKIGKLKKKVILSTGMATMKETGEALKVIISAGTKKENITVLHCNSGYPTPMHDVNLKAMVAIRDKFKIKVGYSDHTMGIEVPVAAAALGAEIIEKHFTLDKKMAGPDHKISLEPDELTAMVKAIRNIEMAMGSGVKKPTQSELKNLNVARKSIHLRCNLNAGHIITEDDLVMKRPGDGISPMEIGKVVGKKIKYTLCENHKLNSCDLK